MRVFFVPRSPFSVPFLDDSNDPIQSGDWESPAGPPPLSFRECLVQYNKCAHPGLISLSLLYLFSFSLLPDYTGLLYSEEEKQVLQTQPPTAHTLCRVHMINYPYFMMHSHGLAFYHKNIQHFRPFFFRFKYPVSFLFLQF